MTRSAPINEAVNLLGEFAPTRLAGMRRQYPQLKDQLQPGGIAGPADRLVVARAKVCLETLDEAEKLCDQAVAVVQRQLRFQRSLSLVGSLAGAMAGATVVATVAARYWHVAIVAGIVSLIGSVASLLADHLGRSPRRGRSVFRTYAELVEMNSNVYLLTVQLRTLLDLEVQEKHEEELTKLTGQGNQLFRDMKRLLTSVLRSHPGRRSATG